MQLPIQSHEPCKSQRVLRRIDLQSLTHPNLQDRRVIVDQSCMYTAHCDTDDGSKRRRAQRYLAEAIHNSTIRQTAATAAAPHSARTESIQKCAIGQLVLRLHRLRHHFVKQATASSHEAPDKVDSASGLD